MKDQDSEEGAEAGGCWVVEGGPVWKRVVRGRIIVGGWFAAGLGDVSL